jgi:hypothetical protein
MLGVIPRERILALIDETERWRDEHRKARHPAWMIEVLACNIRLQALKDALGE